jgi:flagellar hook-length control protein FliK
MLTLTPQIFANSAGLPSATAVASGQANSNSGQFDSILQTILGASAPAAGNAALQTVPGPGFESPALGTQFSFAQLNTIMQKLGKALEAAAQGSGAGQADLMHVMQEVLAPEEIDFLQAMLTVGSPITDSLTANACHLTGEINNDSAQLSSTEIEALLRSIEQLSAGITKILQQAGYGPQEQALPTPEDQQPLAGGEAEKMLGRLAQLRDTMQTAHAELMIKSERLTAATEAGATMPKSPPQNAEKVPATVQQQAFCAATASAAGQAETEPLKALTLTLEEMLNLKLGSQSSDSEESQSATKAGADLLTVVKEGNGIAAQGDFAGSGKQGSLLSQTLQNKAMLLSAQQTGSTSKQPTAAFLGDLELMRVLSNHTDRTINESQLSQLQFIAAAEAKTAATCRVARQPSAVQNILPVEQGAPAQTGQAVQSEHAAKAPAAEQTSQPALLNQVAERIATGIRRGESRLTLQIHPPSLGKVHIDLAIRNNQLRAVIIAETAQAKMLLDAHLDQLKACLENQNLDVSKVSVEVGYDERQFASTLREQRDQERRSMMQYADGIDESQRARPEQEAAAISSAALYTRGGSTVNLFA